MTGRKRNDDNPPSRGSRGGSAVSNNRQSICAKTGEIYQGGEKFRRFSSGRVCPIARGNSNIDNVEAKNWIRKMVLAEKKVSPSHGELLTVNNNESTLNFNSSSYEIVMCKQSFQSDQGMRNKVNRVSSSVNSINKNSVLHTIPSSPTSVSPTSIVLSDDMILTQLVGEYTGVLDKKAFAREIVREVQCLTEFSIESMIEFLMSEEYKSWIKEKAHTWNINHHFNTTIPNSYTIPTGEKTQISSPSLVQIFQESGEGEACIQNNYNYDIKINTNGNVNKSRGSACRKCCVIL